jgi:hypothetical protein
MGAIYFRLVKAKALHGLALLEKKLDLHPKGKAELCRLCLSRCPEKCV